MGPGRFLFFSLLSLLLATFAVVLQLSPSRVGVFLVMGCAGCISLAAYKFINMSNTGRQVGNKLRHISPEDGCEKGYYFLGRIISFLEACRHFLVVGATGTGKSITLNLLMKSVFYRFTRPSPEEQKHGRIKRRALVYDAKQDQVAFLSQILPMERIIILNPLDQRFTPWNIAADVVSETDVREFAEVLIPKNPKESSPYFTNTARALVEGVITRFKETTEKGKFWTLRDVICAFQSRDWLQRTLDHPSTIELLDHFSKENEKNFAGVKSTADTTLGAFRPIAALFHAASTQPDKSGILKTPLSLKDWVNQSGTVLVMGNHENARQATDTLNQLIFRQLSKLLLARPDNADNGETWIFLDEVREAGPLQGLRQLLLRGRSKGVAVAMGFQDIEGMRAVYGPHDGDELMGAPHNCCILKINPNASSTAQWASQVMSYVVEEDKGISTQIGPQGLTMGDSESLKSKPRVYPIEFTELPLPRPGKECVFFGATNELGAVKSAYHWDWLKNQGIVDAPRSKEPAFMERDPSLRQDKLQPWGEDDLVRLGLQDAGIVLPGAKIKPEEKTATPEVGAQILEPEPPRLQREQHHTDIFGASPRA